MEGFLALADLGKRADFLAQRFNAQVAENTVDHIRIGITILESGESVASNASSEATVEDAAGNAYHTVKQDGGDRFLPPTRGTPSVESDFLKRLSGLLPSQFEEVLLRASIPIAHLPGAAEPQAKRAIAAIHYLEQQNRLNQLAWILDNVAGPS